MSIPYLEVVVRFLVHVAKTHSWTIKLTNYPISFGDLKYG